jgi:hypothetical protein
VRSTGNAEGLNSKPCTPHEGSGAAIFDLHQKSSIRSTGGPETKPTVSLLCRASSCASPCAPFLCRIARALLCDLCHAPVRNYRDLPVRPALVPRRVVPAPEGLPGSLSPAGVIKLTSLATRISCRVSASGPSRPVRCGCTLPADRSQRFMPLFDNHSAGSVGTSSATPGAGAGPSWHCPPRRAARRVTSTLSTKARPAAQATLCAGRVQCAVEESG